MTNTEPGAEHTERALAAMLDAIDAQADRSQPDFAEWLVEVVATATSMAALRGKTVLRRSGSWEASLVTGIIQSSGAYDEPERFDRPDPRGNE